MSLYNNKNFSRILSELVEFFVFLELLLDYDIDFYYRITQLSVSESSFSLNS